MIRKNLYRILGVTLAAGGLSLPLFAQAENSPDSRLLLAQDQAADQGTDSSQGGDPSVDQMEQELQQAQQILERTRQRLRDSTCTPSPTGTGPHRP